MTSNPVEPHVDLIDFQVGSPVLPRRSSTSEIHFEHDTENLIDTELPVFEQKLQTQSSALSSQCRRNSVDLEDILINIDSDEFDKDSLDGEEVDADDFLNVCEGVEVDNGNAASTLPVDNFEALLVLKNLDDLLNATLDESEDITNGNSIDHVTNEESEELDDDTQYIIEECLGDLDNYLQAIDNYDTESNLSDGSVDRSSQSGDIDLQEHEEPPAAEFNEELARSKLRQIEENYRKFVTSGIVNRAYIDTENNGNVGVMLDDHLRRPTSACAVASQLFTRKHSPRANTVNCGRRERPRLIRRKSLTENYIAPPTPTLTRTSGTDAVITTTAPDIARLSHDVSRERHAHASADRCTGTVIVEPLHRQCKAGSSSTSTVLNSAETVSSEPCATPGRSPWLRNSMRRLQQLALPNVDRPGVAVNVVEDGGGETSRLEVPDNSRPVSAPSRLPPLTTPSDRSSRSRSRNLVSQQPNGRARSSSASSRSRRRRSVSSSGTSVASSVDSAHSHMPPSEGVGNANTIEDTSNNNQRRYAFLIAGIIYGAGKLTALKALEASRADEKARKKVEKEARLVEEKRLAAERDFQQILEVFRPPPRAGDSSDNIEPPVQTSGDPNMAAEVTVLEGKTPQCETNYETVYDNDDLETIPGYSPPPTMESSDKPLDISVDDNEADRNISSEDYLQGKEDSGYVFHEFGDLPVLPPEDGSCRIPPEK